MMQSAWSVWRIVIVYRTPVGRTWFHDVFRKKNMQYRICIYSLTDKTIRQTATTIIQTWLQKIYALTHIYESVPVAYQQTGFGIRTIGCGEEKSFRHPYSYTNTPWQNCLVQRCKHMHTFHGIHFKYKTGDESRHVAPKCCVLLAYAHIQTKWWDN